MNRTVTPSVLAERIQQKTGIDKETAKNFSFAFFDLVKSQLKKEPVFVIQKFGRFRKIFVEASLKRNPMTNQMVEIPAHYKIRFTPSKSLASRLNAKYAHLKAKALKLKKTAARQFCENEHTPEQLLTQNMQELCESTKPEKKHGRLAAGVAAVLLILLCSLMLLAIKLVGLPDFFNSKKKTNGNTDGFSGKNPALEKLEKVKEEENLAETEKHDMLLSSSEKSVQVESETSQEIKDLQKDLQDARHMQEFEVPQGFCYYKIAEQELGNRHLWPVIFAENSEASLTGGIPNPDFVKAHSEIFIPVPDEDEKKEFPAYWKDAYLKTYNAYYRLMETQPNSPRNSLRQFRAVRVLVSAEIIFPGFLQENEGIIKTQDFQDALKIFKNRVP